MSEEVMKQQVAPTEAKTKVKRPKSKARKIIEWVLFGIFGVIFAFILAGNVDGMIHKEANYGQSIRFGVGSFIVLTSSMDPEIPQDSAILTYKEDVTTFKDRIDKGETIDVTFANIAISTMFEPDTPEFKRINGGQMVVSNQVMTHRLREVHEDPTIEFGKGRFIFVASGINTQGDYAKMGQYQIFTEVQYLGVVKVANAFLGGVFNFIASPVGLIILLLVPAGYLIVMSSIDIFKAMKEAEEGETSGTKSSASGDKLSSLSDADKERLKKELLDEMIKAKMEAKKNEDKR